jgi:hypothetical protein
MMQVGHDPNDGNVRQSRRSQSRSAKPVSSISVGITARLDRVNADAIFARWFALDFTGS